MATTYKANGLYTSSRSQLQGTTYANWGFDITNFTETSLNFRVNWKPKTNRSQMYIRCYVTSDYTSEQWYFRNNRTNFYYTNTDSGDSYTGNNYMYVTRYFATANTSTPHHCLDLTLHNYARDGKLWPSFHAHHDYTYSNSDNSTSLIAMTDFISGTLFLSPFSEYTSSDTNTVGRIQFFLTNSASYEEFDVQVYQDGGLLHG
jgi:hypothetical protein